MFDNDTDKEWEKFGEVDPYFGVLTEDKYRSTNLDMSNKKDFMGSGHEYLGHVLAVIKKHIVPELVIKNALDFGCGVGRVTLPLAKYAVSVTGIDVSAAMLDEAQKNCDEQKITNVRLLKSDDQLSTIKEKFDFIHSFIVFQHIRTRRGEGIFRNLLTHLEDGGCCVVQFVYAKTSRVSKLASFIKSNVPFAQNVVNLMIKRPFFYPVMQMNIYDLNAILLIIQKAGVRDYYAEFTNHGGCLGIILYFQYKNSSKQ
jgi:ubiquinone/menaquinone biosynthesis C-methylase UbiE